MRIGKDKRRGELLPSLVLTEKIEDPSTLLGMTLILTLRKTGIASLRPTFQKESSQSS
jgi:hypothetical protein